MKFHYYKEIILLIILSLAAATLAADHHFYDLVWDLFNIPHSTEEDKKAFENTVAVVRLIAFGSVIFLSIVNIWGHLHSEKRIIESLLASISKIYFKNVDVTTEDGNKIYRTTCYKFYEFNLASSLFLFFISIGLFLLLNIKLPLYYSIPITILIITFYLFVIDSWWFQFFSRLLKFDSARNMKLGKNYLLSYVRYGHESGKLNKVNTTMPFLIDETNNKYRLFVGDVFKSQDDIVQSLNHHGINSLIENVNNRIEKNDIDAFKPFLNATLEKNISKLRELSAFSKTKTATENQNCLTVEEQNKIINFMEQTNTFAYDLFDINDRKHCEHFLAYKIKYEQNNKVWGIILVDILSNDNVDFYEYLKIDKNDDWLKLLMKSHSTMFSKAIINQNHD